MNIFTGTLLVREKLHEGIKKSQGRQGIVILGKYGNTSSIQAKLRQTTYFTAMKAYLGN